MHSSPSPISVHSWRLVRNVAQSVTFHISQVISVAVTAVESCMNVNQLFPKPPNYLRRHERTAKKESSSLHLSEL